MFFSSHPLIYTNFLVEGCNCHSVTLAKEGKLCSVVGDYKSRCSCLKKNVPCTRHCRCIQGCDNRKLTGSEVVHCRCGVGQKKGYISCTNRDGKRATKCPCYKTEVKCTDKCGCKGCANGKESSTPKRQSATTPQREREHRTHVKARTTKYLGKIINQCNSFP